MGIQEVIVVLMVSAAAAIVIKTVIRFISDLLRG